MNIDTIAWPNNKKFAVCLSHDVDRVKKTYQYLSDLVTNRIYDKNKLVNYLKSIFDKEAYWNFYKIMKDLTEKFPDLIKSYTYMTYSWAHKYKYFS